MLAAQSADPDSLPHRPLVDEYLSNSVLAGLLLAADHRYRDEFARPGRSCHPRTVSRAIDAMEADPAYPFTAVALARATAVSVRTLQDGFRRYVGMAPMTYLRHLRLARVHEELRLGDPRSATVAEVASRWGFGHLGRFAAAYRAKYGVAPSVTLRSPG